MRRYLVYPLLPVALVLCVLHAAWRNSPYAERLAPALAAPTAAPDEGDVEALELRHESDAAAELQHETVASAALSTAAHRAMAVELGRRLGRGASGEGFEAPMALMGVTASATIEAAAASLADGNDDPQPASLRERMALIDFLGVASRTHELARLRLFDFATSPLDARQRADMLHLDVTDRLEAFVYVAALAPGHAAEHVKRLPGVQFKSRFIVQFIAGREYAGDSHADAVEQAYAAFSGDADLAFANPNNQKGQP